MDQLEEAKSLRDNPEFQQALAADQKIGELINERSQGAANAGLELAVATSGMVLIAGREFPAPAAACFCLLEAIGSPFLPREEEELDHAPGDIDVFRALYLLDKRADAVRPILRIQHRADQIERLENKYGNEIPPECLFILSQQRQALADTWAEFDQQVLEYGDSLGRFNPVEAARDIAVYLQLAGGFDWFPRIGKEEDEKKNATVTSSP
ncbi:MAG: hypothetical protein PHQ27_10495 [Victivallales bacterium]|nr:hypothetical protein [Victivallales bacterium]